MKSRKPMFFIRRCLDFLEFIIIFDLDQMTCEKNLVSIKIVATFTSKPDYSDNSILEFAEDICYSWMVGKDSDVIMRSAANESCSLNVR